MDSNTEVGVAAAVPIDRVMDLMKGYEARWRVCYIGRMDTDFTRFA